MRTIIMTLAASASILAYAKADETGTGTTAPETNPAPEGNGESAHADYVILSPSNEDGSPALDMNAGLPPVIDKSVIQAIKKAVGGDRAAHASYELALESLQAGMEKTNNYANLPVISYRPDGFGEGVNAVVATVRTRVKESKDADGKVIPATNGIRAILIFPQPTIDTFWEDEQGKEWLAKLAEREASDVGFSSVRAAESVLSLCNAVKGMPISVESITRETRANAIDTSLFDDNWQAFKDAFCEKNPAFKGDGMIPQKPIMLKAIRSEQFAKDHPATQALEQRGLIVKIANMFVGALKAAKNPETDESMGHDTTILEGWINDRAKVELSAGAKPDVNALDSISNISFG